MSVVDYFALALLVVLLCIGSWRGSELCCGAPGHSPPQSSFVVHVRSIAHQTLCIYSIFPLMRTSGRLALHCCCPAPARLAG